MSTPTSAAVQNSRQALCKTFYHLAAILRSRAFKKAIGTAVSAKYPSTAPQTFAKLKSNFDYQLSYNLKTIGDLADGCAHLADSIVADGRLKVSKRERSPQYHDIAEYYSAFPFDEVYSASHHWRTAYGPAVYVPFTSARSECHLMLHETRAYIKALVTLRDGVESRTFAEMMAFANREPNYFYNGYPADVLVWDAISIQHGESARFFLRHDYCSSVMIRDSQSNVLDAPSPTTHTVFRHVQPQTCRPVQAA